MGAIRRAERRPLGGLTPHRAAGFFDPAFAQPPAAQQVRAVLDQARTTPRFDPNEVELDEAVRTSCATHHRVEPLVERGWPRADRARTRRRSMGQLRLRAVASEVIEVLSAEGIESRVLKGLATGPLDYDSARLRETGDVDLLMAFDDVVRAERILVGRGCRANGLERLPSTMLKGPTLIHPSGVEIDLHFRLDALVTFPAGSELMADPVAIADGMTALPTELRLVHAALHSLVAVPGQRRLSSVADIVAIIDNTGVDWTRARSLADALHLTEFVAEALRLEAALVGREHHPGLDWPGLPRWKARVMLSDDHHMPTRHALMLANLPPGESGVGYVARWLFPEKEFLARRGGLAGHFTTMWASLRA